MLWSGSQQGVGGAFSELQLLGVVVSGQEAEDLWSAFMSRS